MADQSGKTEQPTQRRLKKAREEGQFPAAREFVAALQFLVFLCLLGAGGAGLVRAIPADHTVAAAPRLCTGFAARRT